MADIRAGRIAGQTDPPKIGEIVQPGLRSVSVRVRRDPFQRRPAIVVAGRDRVLRREAVLDGDGHGVGPGGEGADVGVVLGTEGGFDAEGAAVDVEEEGEAPARVVVGRGGGDENSGGDVGLGRDGDVFGSESGLGVVGGGDNVGGN